ncbi:metallophosphoesterase family protein [Lacticaseibacillus thailandensis]|nr:metallophosphoesterase family protein [Lacticaseibacillus thailandensis]
MTKVAIISDIHGNVTALRAVLADAQQAGVDEYWCLGDIYMPGPGAEDVWTLINAVHPTIRVRGNWDDFAAAIMRGSYHPRRPMDIFVARNVRYLLERMPAADLQALGRWPLCMTRMLGGLHFGIQHNLPDINYGHTLYPRAEQSNFKALFADGQTDVAVYGHIHTQLVRYGDAGQLVLNPGAVGQPYSPYAPLRRDQRARYMLLTVGNQGLTDIDLRHVDYDVDAELALARARALPYYDLYVKLRRTGLASTHDEATLRRFNEQFGYTADVTNYFPLSTNDSQNRH